MQRIFALLKVVEKNEVGYSEYGASGKLYLLICCDLITILLFSAIMMPNCGLWCSMKALVMT